MKLPFPSGKEFMRVLKAAKEPMSIEQIARHSART
jgi:hypothetical protein